MYGQTLFMIIIIAHVLPIVVKDVIVDSLYPTLVKLVMEEIKVVMMLVLDHLQSVDGFVYTVINYWQKRHTRSITSSTLAMLLPIVTVIVIQIFN